MSRKRSFHGSSSSSSFVRRIDSTDENEAEQVDEQTEDMNGRSSHSTNIKTNEDV